jgi:AraC-like DNA-binding protein
MFDRPIKEFGTSPPPNSEIIANLLADALALLDRDHRTARTRIEQARNLAQHDNAGSALERGALAPWQVRRVEDHIRTNLAESLRIDELATIAKLSPGYFSRAFKATFGASFSSYIVDRRVDRAMQLLLTTDQSICDVALACGLADQPHLTRLFSKRVGLPPNAWRRRMRDVPAPCKAESRSDTVVPFRRDLDRT